ncbi:carbohydrate kinase family protein [Fodinibacter luteus]|uniref:Carbohydrate kinase family protein n=1 Tax=Fodinibacter luteus TaxID=552064 RepID=A0ABP8K7T3_9MICO
MGRPPDESAARSTAAESTVAAATAAESTVAPTAVGSPAAGAGGRHGVLCAGTAVVDLSKVIDHYPPLDHIAIIEEFSLGTGGPGLNMAVDLTRLGAPFPVAFAGVVGEDANGDHILAACRAAGIDASGLVRVAGADTSFTDAMVERHGGRRTFFHHVGANALLTDDLLDVEGSAARILHLGAPGLHPRLDETGADGRNGWVRLLERAQVAGIRTNLELVSLDPARMAEVAAPCLPHLDTIVINDLEAAALLGSDLAAEGADESVPWPGLERLALGLVDRGVRRLAVVHFPAGCVAAAPGGRVWRQGSVRVPRDAVRSTTGAGDAFAAGVLHGIHEEWPVERSLALGVASAAACLTSPTTSDGVGPAAEVLASATTWGHRPTE